MHVKVIYVTEHIIRGLSYSLDTTDLTDTILNIKRLFRRLLIPVNGFKRS